MSSTLPAGAATYNGSCPASAEDPESFFITEMARDVGRTIRPLTTECGGWRSVFKRK